MSHRYFDLRGFALREMKEAGFETAFPPAALHEAQAARDSATAESPAAPGVRDLRELLWSSVDNDDSLDLDQIEVAEELPDRSEEHTSELQSP